MISSASSAANASIRSATSIPARIAALPRQIEVHRAMARLGRVQRCEQFAERTADGRTQRREALAGARLDERAANHQIDFALRLGPCDQAAQASAHSGRAPCAAARR